jgi:hypothetical protein
VQNNFNYYLPNYNFTAGEWLKSLAGCSSPFAQKHLKCAQENLDDAEGHTILANIYSMPLLGTIAFAIEYWAAKIFKGKNFYHEDSVLLDKFKSKRIEDLRSFQANLALPISSTANKIQTLKNYHSVDIRGYTITVFDPSAGGEKKLKEFESFDRDNYIDLILPGKQILRCPLTLAQHFQGFFKSQETFSKNTLNLTKKRIDLRSHEEILYFHTRGCRSFSLKQMLKEYLWWLNNPEEKLRWRNYSLLTEYYMADFWCLTEFKDALKKQIEKIFNDFKPEDLAPLFSPLLSLPLEEWPQFHDKIGAWFARHFNGFCQNKEKFLQVHPRYMHHALGSNHISLDGLDIDDPEKFLYEKVLEWVKGNYRSEEANQNHELDYSQSETLISKIRWEHCSDQDLLNKMMHSEKLSRPFRPKLHIMHNLSGDTNTPIKLKWRFVPKVHSLSQEPIEDIIRNTADRASGIYDVLPPDCEEVAPSLLRAGNYYFYLHLDTNNDVILRVYAYKIPESFALSMKINGRELNFKVEEKLWLQHKAFQRYRVEQANTILLPKNFHNYESKFFTFSLRFKDIPHPSDEAQVNIKASQFKSVSKTKFLGVESGQITAFLS